MKFLFLIGAFNAFFFLILLLQKKPRLLYDTILAYWLAYLGVYIGLYAFFTHSFYSDYPIISVSFISFLMLHGPFLYLYVSSYAGMKTAFKLSDFLHFIPFAAFNIYLLIHPGAETSERITLNHSAASFNPPPLFLLFLVLTVISGPVYFIATYRKLKILKNNIENNYSTFENIDMSWLRKLIIIFGIIWTGLMLAAVSYHILHFFSMQFCTDGLFASLSVFIILLGYFGLKQKEIFIQSIALPKQDFSQKTKKYSGSYLKESEAIRIKDRLLEHMAVTKPFLNPDLTMPQLAGELDIQPHYLSQVLNENLNLSFFDFINRYRVEEVKSKIADPDLNNLSILGIAFESGFNSKSAFNRIFKKVTGKTPSQYKESLINPVQA